MPDRIRCGNLNTGARAGGGMRLRYSMLPVVAFTSLALTACFDEPLKNAEMLKLNGRAGVQSGTTFAGTLYNGNGDVTVTEVAFVITTVEAGRSSSREYRVKLKTAPLSAQEFSFPILQGDYGASYTWSIARALGRP